MAGRKRKLQPIDSIFLIAETPRTMMHVAALMPFTPPADAGPTYVRDLVHRWRELPVESPFDMRLTHPQLLSHPLQGWVQDDEFDIEYHVRRSALASPGDERELGILVSRLHSHQLDMTRPLWECHVIEGLEDNRFAVYAKIHHSLMDGYSSVQLLARSLSRLEEPGHSRPFWAADPPERRKPPRQVETIVEQVAKTAVSATKVSLGTATGATNIAKAVLRLEVGSASKELINGREAPRTILNRRTGRNRRLATQVWDTARLKAMGKATDSTLNDVMLAIIGQGLRKWLIEQEALPEAPLISFVPMNIRAEGDTGGGNMVAATLVSLATDVADPVEQLRAIKTSTTAAKHQMRDLNQASAIAYTGYLFAPAAFQTFAALAGVKNPFPTTFNLCISNVVGPSKPLYLEGSKLEAIFPMSIPAHGFALNITVESYAGMMNVGFVGCRDAVPRLQRLAVYCGEALEELEAAIEGQ